MNAFPSRISLWPMMRRAAIGGICLYRNLGMNVHVRIFFAVLGCSITLQGQTSPAAKFAGCYEIVSQKWHPGNEDASPIPGRFELRNKQADERSTDFFQMWGIPPGRNDWDSLWVWRPTS